ncbi:tRNA lysidine(34) synthetase TilS [Dehalobacterium formicoaceticum]|uniref:tRNA lysidine(34) synthetase TilS n=1 Tax=Dehalobacterium formicoaceticum TaxID=51515 RepID=UPI0031F61BE2
MIKRKILTAIEKYHLIAPGNTLVLAVSGGPDSMALLHILGQIAVEWQLKLHAAHLNHMMRGTQGEEEAAFVAAKAQEMGFPCRVARVDVPRYLQETGLSPEEGARILRYQFLHRAAQETQADGIVTAHHGDDQAETVLLHLLRGTGPEGLAAMSPREGALIRPMLGIAKEEILAYCREQGIAYCLDPTNQEEIYTRNRIRLGLIPRLKQFNPRIIPSLVKTADILREENDLLQELTRSAGEKIKVLLGPGERGMDFDQMKSFHPAIQRRLIRQMMDDFAGSQGALTFDHTEALLSLAPGQELFLPGPIYAYREGSTLIFSPEKRKAPAAPVLAPVELTAPGTTYLPRLARAVTVSLISWPETGLTPDRETQVFSSDILQETLTIRNRRGGDYFYPRGMRGKKKIKDFFIDEKIPQSQRATVPLLLAGDQIVWVAGYRRSRLFEAGRDDHKAVLVRLKKSCPS